ncbi:MAG: SEC-C metal-binding domain-containing protein [Pseudomonadota bacterium]|nr:SEC-C metal-binding domain-containing protein [Pseudomonadota bacterium]
MKPVRTEEEVMLELEKLASSPGYLHAVAYLCFRENFVSYSPDDTREQFAKLYSATKIIRSEVSTLIGLALKHPVNWEIPHPHTLESYLNDTESLLEELHDNLNAPMFDILQKSALGDRCEDPFSSGSVLREAVFYGSDSAYTFQYRDFSVPKYEKDDTWLTERKGFCIAEAKSVAEEAGKLVTKKLLQTIESFRTTHQSTWTFLPAFEISPEELISETKLPRATVEKVLQAFSVTDQPLNAGFQNLNDFNTYNAYPLIKRNGDTYLCLQQHSLLEALYESPFYWMLSDKSYADKATANRGLFLEHLSHNRLKRVFGAERVWSNILIVDKHGDRAAAEIDTLVLFGNRAIVVQAKSKRMTLEARKGNDSIIQRDFAKSIQASYDQGLRCAELIGNPSFRLLLNDTNEELTLPTPIQTVHLFCLVSDHYPALSAQSRQFLKMQVTERIPPPFVMDAFLLDAMTEMLVSPLYFISYIDRRVSYNDRIMASHELTILSYHLKFNLWVDREYNLVQLGDDIATDLDLAMMVRRDGIEGSDTPEGILTRLKGTTFEQIIKQIDQDPRDNAVDLGIFLLGLNEDTATQVGNAVDQLSNRAMVDGASHDFTIGGGSEGLTVHITQLPIAIAEPRLHHHCERKKYQQRAKKWFGLLMLPEEATIRLIGKLDFKWRRDVRVEAEIAALPGTRKFTKPLGEGGRKIGRNDPCPCGSGKKFKRCCN